MAENSQLSGNMKNSSTGTSSTDASSEAIGKHENEIVPHKISNHDKLVQTMVMVDGEWINVNDTNDQANMKDDMNKVNKKVVEAQKGIVEAKSAADSAAKAADSAVSASVVNSDAITAQSAAISEAKSAISSATAAIQQTAATAASDAAKIRADVAQVQNEVDTAKAANSASVEALKSDVSAAKQDIQAARQANENVAKQLDDYTKQAQAQGNTIKDIQNAQDGYTATLADVKGNVSKISDAVDGLSASLKDDQDNVATIKAKADELSATLTDHDKNIAQLTASAKELSSTLEDADGRLSKVEQTASTLVSEFSDQQGRLNRVEQKTTGTEQTVANQQGQINVIKTDAAGIHETLTGQGNQIANINVTLGGLSTKYDGVSGDLSKLSDKVTTNSTQIDQDKKLIALKADQTTVNNLSGEVSHNAAQLKVQADQISSKVSSDDFKTLDNKVGGAITQIQKNSTDIDQTNQKISLKADQTEVDQVKQTATQNSSRLNVMAGEISSKVTSTDVNNIVDKKGYATTSTVQSLITQSAGSINETITNLTSKVNSNNGGGINLLTGTGNNLSVTGKNTSNQTIHKYSLTNGYNVSSLASRFGTQFTLSFDWSVSGSSPSGTFKAQWNNVPWGLDPVVTVSKSNTSGHVSSTFSVSTDSENVAHMMGFRLDNFVGTLTVSNMKLEKGSVATPWSPAPSDEATVTQVQQITASVDGLKSTVASKADKSQITQLSNVIQSKVSSSDFTSKVSQLSNDINARVTKGDLLSQINIEAGRALIQSNKIYFDADSFVMSPNSKAFIPSAFITNLSADKITTGTLDASKLHVKNFSADNISGGTLSGITVKTGVKDRYFQTSKDSIYWVHDNKTSLIGTDQYINPSDGISIADQHSITLTTWHGATINSDGSITNEAGNIGHPKIVIDLDGKWNPEASGGSNWDTGTGATQIGQWVADKEYTNLVQGKGFTVHLDDQNKYSMFAIQKDNCVGAYFGQGDHGNQINFFTAGDGRGVNINGNFHVTGSKNSIVETKQGYLAINAYETAEYYFGDIGENNTGNTGQITIGIDRIFNETVNTNIQYQVFVTSYSDTHVWVEKRYSNRFVVKSDKPNAEFGWELKAKRRGYESNRLRRVDVDFDQANIKGDN